MSNYNINLSLSLVSLIAAESEKLILVKDFTSKWKRNGKLLFPIKIWTRNSISFAICIVRDIILQIYIF